MATTLVSMSRLKKQKVKKSQRIPSFFPNRKNRKRVEKVFKK